MALTLKLCENLPTRCKAILCTMKSTRSLQQLLLFLTCCWTLLGDILVIFLYLVANPVKVAREEQSLNWLHRRKSYWEAAAQPSHSTKTLRSVPPSQRAQGLPGKTSEGFKKKKKKKPPNNNPCLLTHARVNKSQLSSSKHCTPTADRVKGWTKLASLLMPPRCWRSVSW